MMALGENFSAACPVFAGFPRHATATSVRAMGGKRGDDCCACSYNYVGYGGFGERGASMAV